MRTLLAPAFWAAIGLGLSAIAAAQPVVRVGASAHIQLTAEHLEQGPRLRIALRGAPSDPIAHAPIEVHARRTDGVLILQQRVRTDADGHAALALPSVEGSLRVRARFAGDAYHPPADAEQLIDAARAPVELRFLLEQGAALDLARPEHDVRVRARAARVGGADLSVELWTDSGEALASAVTDAEGVAALTVASAKLGDVGPSVLHARTDGDALRAPAEAELHVVRYRATQTTLEIAADADGRGLRARGATRTTAGLGVAHAAVGIFGEGGEHLATVSADDLGRFHHALDSAHLASLRTDASELANSVALHARFESDAPWLGSSRSAATTVPMAPENDAPLLWLLGTPLLIAALLALMRRIRPARTPAVAGAGALSAGVALAAQAPRRSLHRGIEFSVVEARTGHSLEAIAELTTPDSSFEPLRLERTGNKLARAHVADGAYTLRVSAPSFRTLEIAFRSPHRGEWSGAVVRLESLRDAAVRAWDPLAVALARSHEQAGAMTLRERVERMLIETPARATQVRALLVRTERAAYEPDAPTDADVARLERETAAISHDTTELDASQQSATDPRQGRAQRAHARPSSSDDA